MAKWYEDQMLQTVIREYKSQGEMQTDANAAAEHGWRIVSTSQLDQRVGCMRILFTGFLALLWKPKPRIMATYARS